MRKRLIHNEWFFPEDDDALIDLVDKHMGHDTADALREIIDNSECHGECDETYKVADHYKRIIRDAVDDLEGIAVYAKHEARKTRLLKMLEAEL